MGRQKMGGFKQPEQKQDCRCCTAVKSDCCCQNNKQDKDCFCTKNK